MVLVAAHLPLPTTPVATGGSTGRSEAPCTSRTGAAPGAAGLVTSPGAAPQVAPQAAMWASSTQPMRATVRGLSPRSTAAAATAGVTKALGQSGGVQTLGACVAVSVAVFGGPEAMFPHFCVPLLGHLTVCSLTLLSSLSVCF